MAIFSPAERKAYLAALDDLRKLAGPEADSSTSTTAFPPVLVVPADAISPLDLAFGGLASFRTRRRGSFIYQKATALHATNERWAFVVRYNGDIFAVNRGGSDGKTELHVLTAASDYQSFSVHVGTGLHATDANWDFGVNYDGDLFAIHRTGASGRVEVHILTAASGYQDFLVHAVTALHPVNSTWDLLIGPENDLYAITRNGGSGKTEVHVMRASNSYSTLAFQMATGLHRTGSNWSFAVSSNRDICGALHNGGSGTAEVHVLTADSNYQEFGLHASTGLHPINPTWTFAAPQPFAPGFIQRNGTGSGMTEVHVPEIIMPRSVFQSEYLALMEVKSDAELSDLAEECAFQAAVWGAAGAVTGGVRGFVAGAVAGALSSSACRDLIKDAMRDRDFERMDRTNHDLERWDHDRNIA